MIAWLRKWAAAVFAAVGAVGVVLIVLGLLFLRGELAHGFRAACGARDAGWLTRHLCDWFDVVPPAPVVATQLQPDGAGERAERHVVPVGEVAQGIEVLDLKRMDLEELERVLQRDLDGDGVAGRVTPRASSKPAEIVLASAAVPELCRGARLVTTLPAAGGAVRNDIIPNEVPGHEWPHLVEYQLSSSLPVNEHELGEELRLSAEWTFLRTGPFWWSAEPYFEKLPPVEAELLGKTTDWGAEFNLSLSCRGLFRCRPQ